jgi:hypothetical protein
LPTNLPRPSVKPKLSIFTIVLNTFMVCTALLLTAAVLVQEERYAAGDQPLDIAGAVEQLTQNVPIDLGGDTMAPPTRP